MIKQLFKDEPKVGPAQPFENPLTREYVQVYQISWSLEVHQTRTRLWEEPRHIVQADRRPSFLPSLALVLSILSLGVTLETLHPGQFYLASYLSCRQKLLHSHLMENSPCMAAAVVCQPWHPSLSQLHLLIHDRLRRHDLHGNHLGRPLPRPHPPLYRNIWSSPKRRSSSPRAPLNGSRHSPPKKRLLRPMQTGFACLRISLSANRASGESDIRTRSELWDRRYSI